MAESDHPLEAVRRAIYNFFMFRKSCSWRARDQFSPSVTAGVEQIVRITAEYFRAAFEEPILRRRKKTGKEKPASSMPSSPPTKNCWWRAGGQ